MNLIESYIQEIYSVEDVTAAFENAIGTRCQQRTFLVRMRVDCYGCVEDVEKVFYESEWEKVKQQGFYLS